MTRPPNDQIDPYESRLARRVGSFSEQAVRHIDPVAMAASAAVGARRRTLAGRLFGTAGPASRLAVIGAGALLIAALGVAIGAGGGLFGPSQTATATEGAVGPGPTPTLVPGSELGDVCSHRALSGLIARWEGAAGHRIATVSVHNDAPTPCQLPSVLQATLTDKNGQPLISGPAVTATSFIPLPAGGSASTLVQVGNYCGPAPLEPVTIQFTMPDGGVFALVPHEGVGDIGGVPPCNGPGPTDDIQMQPFTPGS